MPRLSFKMASKDDLSARADFSFDLMQSLGKVAQSAIEDSQAIADLKSKAKVHVSFSGSLRSIDIAIKVTPLPDVDLSSEELASARERVGNLIHETVQSRLTDLVQTALNGARARM